MENNEKIEEQSNTIKIKKLEVTAYKSKKTNFVNFTTTCEFIKRDEQQLMKFISLELDTKCSINLNGSLIIEGKYTIREIENILKKYLAEYVICSMCKSINTNLIKEQKTRLYYLKCQDCLAERTVETIK